MTEHHHNHAAHLPEGSLKISLVVTSLFVVFELAAGLSAHSLALISDAGHNLTDAAALALAWYAVWIARKPATPKKTYGYHRVSILTALLNSFTLVIIAVLIFSEAIHLLLHPRTDVQSMPMIAVAAVGVVVNTLIAVRLHGGASHNVNMRSAYVHMAGDALSSVGVIAAGLVLRFTGWHYADPIVSLLIAAFIATSSWSIIHETINVLMEGTPDNIDVAQLADAVKRIPGVEDVHDLHVWTIADNLNALSCHVVFPAVPLAPPAQVVAAIKEMLAHHYAVGHSTIETECDGCDTDALYCNIRPAEICMEHHSAGHAEH